MGKYKLSELLNEIQGGRTGTYLATLDELERVRDTIKEFSGMRYRQQGPSRDGKVVFEYEFDPKRGGAFSIYPYKFDPRNDSPFEPKEFSFSVAGDIGAAIFYVKEAARRLGIEEANIFKGNQFQNQNENLEEVTMANVNVDEIKAHLDAYKAGDITGDDLHQAISEIFFGKVVPPGLKEMTADEFGGDEASVARIAKFQNKSPEQVRQEVSDMEYEEIADAFINKLPPYVDRSKFTKAQLGRMIVDFMYDGDLEKAFDVIDSKNLEEMKMDTGMFIDDEEFETEMGRTEKDSEMEIDKELERMENLEEQISDDDIRKALNGRDYEIDAYMAALEATGQKFDTIQDYIDDFEEYRADRALKEQFGRFLKNYQ